MDFGGIFLAESITFPTNISFLRLMYPHRVFRTAITTPPGKELPRIVKGIGDVFWNHTRASRAFRYYLFASHSDDLIDQFFGINELHHPLGRHDCE